METDVYSKGTAFLLQGLVLAKNVEFTKNVKPFNSRLIRGSDLRV